MADRNAPKGSLPALVAGLAVQVHEMNDNLLAIAARLDTRPSRNESRFRARSFFVVALLVIMCVGFVIDQHTEVCGPGHRSEEVLDAIQRGEIVDNDDFLAVVEDATPSDLCGFTFPLHTHNGSDWPEDQHVFGLLFYSGIFVALGAWVLVPWVALRRERAEDLPHRVLTINEGVPE